jgi:hypothetical protein
VEYARRSKTRGGAPTLAPHTAGASVKAQILVVDDGPSVEAAQDMLWRRETRRAATAEPYPVGSSPNSVRVERTSHPSVATVLCTDFPPEGKTDHPTAEGLAKAAIESVPKAPPGKDGITFLRHMMAAGIKTPLTEDYAKEVLRQTGTESLRDALATLIADAERNSEREPA